MDDCIISGSVCIDRENKENLTKTFFAPQLYIQSGVRDISFYTAGLSAVELRRWTNDDGSLHVAELSIHGAIFQIHYTPFGNCFLLLSFYI